MIEVGIISEVQGKRVRVSIGSMVTDFLPVMQFANSFAVHWKPLRVGEQCLIIPIRGELNSGVVIRSLSYDDFDFSHTKEDEEFVKFEDGTTLLYNTSSSTLEVLNPKDMNIVCSNSVNIIAKDVNITATTTTIKSPNINLLGNTLIQGTISTMGTDGKAGNFSINGDLDISQSLTTGTNAKIGGTISDIRGDLTNHTNDGYSRD